MRGEESAAQLRADLAQANEYWRNAQQDLGRPGTRASAFAEATAAARVQQDSAFRDRSRVGRAAQTEQRARQMRADLIEIVKYIALVRNPGGFRRSGG